MRTETVKQKETRLVKAIAVIEVELLTHAKVEVEAAIAARDLPKLHEAHISALGTENEAITSASYHQKLDESLVLRVKIESNKAACLELYEALAEAEDDLAALYIGVFFGVKRSRQPIAWAAKILEVMPSRIEETNTADGIFEVALKIAESRCDELKGFETKRASILRQAVDKMMALGAGIAQDGSGVI